jgi:hypothetical protein
LPSASPSVRNCPPDECHSILLGETETVVFRSWQYIRIECVWYQHTGGRGIIRHAREPSISSHLMSMSMPRFNIQHSTFKLQGLSPRPVKMQVRYYLVCCVGPLGYQAHASLQRQTEIPF